MRDRYIVQKRKKDNVNDKWEDAYQSTDALSIIAWLCAIGNNQDLIAFNLKVVREVLIGNKLVRTDLTINEIMTIP